MEYFIKLLAGQTRTTSAEVHYLSDMVDFVSIKIKAVYP